MCGIGGIICKNHSYSNLLEDLVGMAATLHHRGPDDEGFLFIHPDDSLKRCFGSKTASETIEKHQLESLSNVRQPSVGLLHKRLSILDTSFSGHQPMACADNRFYIIHNGEIYNFIELRKELQNIGVVFKSNTDTEVILEAYKFWGKKMLSKLNGMWAFAIYDTINRSIFFARDRFGVKPLYFINTKSAFAFASEIKALTKSSLIERYTINHKAVSDYLVNTIYEPVGDTFFKEIQELKAGHYMEYQLDTHSMHTNSFYQLHTTEKWENPIAESFQNYVKEVRAKVSDSINIRLRSDVSVGACLSGGIDSSVLVAYIQGKQEVQTFTSSFRDGGEQSFAAEVMKGKEKLWHQSYPTAEGFKNNLEDLIYTHDQPFYNTSTFAQFELMKLVNEKGIKVTLDGQGADELFGGYSRHYFEVIKEAWFRGDFTTVSRFLFSKGNKFADKKGLLKEVIKKNVKLKNPYHNYFQPEFYQGCFSDIDIAKLDPSLNRLLMEDFTGNTLKGIFRTADRNSMRFSVESRMPFADDINLIESVFSIPSTYKIKESTNKVLLREAFRDILPSKIYQRKDKVGFYTPELSWIKSIDNELLRYLTEDIDEYVNVKKLKTDWSKIMNNPNMNSGWVWRVLNFAIWKKVYSL